MTDATSAAAVAGGPPPAKRDWVAWYEDLDERERREMRDRLIQASPDEVRADPHVRDAYLGAASDDETEDATEAATATDAVPAPV